MNLKVKALAIMAGIFGGTILVVGLFQIALETYGVRAVGNVIVSGFMLGLCYMMYSLILNKFEYDEKLKELNSKDSK